MHAFRRLAALLCLAVFAAAPPARAERDLFGLGLGTWGAHTQNDKSAVNVYLSITDTAQAGDSTLTTTGDATAFTEGDLVLVWATSGMDAEPAPNQTEITLSGSGPAGRWEFARIATIAGNVFTLTAPLYRGPYAGAHSQLVLVPEFTDVTIKNGQALLPAAWNGATGGIVVFLATGAVTVEGNGMIDANATGFRGGTAVDSSGSTQLTGCADNFGTQAEGYAAKGEGTYPGDYDSGSNDRGMGSIANGGGGGNCHNAGGGGGGNGGAGGQGGNSWEDDRAVGGMGGAAIADSPLSRLVPGGGGGAGEENNSNGKNGGIGGGVVFFRAASLHFAGDGRVRATGAGVANLDSGGCDGNGGGGAGGTILIRLTGAVTCATTGKINANGGNGGNTSSTCGGGGGGGGGKVLVQATSNGCAVNLAAGTAGTGGHVGGAGAAGVQVPPPAGPFCFDDAPCAALTGTPHCLASVGFCVQCADDSQCPDEAPVCDSTSRTCRTCTSDDECASGRHCDLDSGDAEFGRCVACLSGGDCASPTVCNPANACVRCLLDGDCQDPLPVCRESLSDCVQCRPLVEVSCPEADNPACSETSWMCAPCTDDYAAATDAPCPTEEHPACVSGQCLECSALNQARCGSADKPACLPSGSCGCDQDSDCRGTSQLRLCETSICIDGCRGTDDQCPADQECSSKDSSAGTCQALVPDAGTPDAAIADAGEGDAGPADAGRADAAQRPDAEEPGRDAEEPGADAEEPGPDAGRADAAMLADAAAAVPTDAGTPPALYDLGGCGCSGAGAGAALPWALFALALLPVRRRR